MIMRRYVEGSRSLVMGGEASARNTLFAAAAVDSVRPGWRTSFEKWKKAGVPAERCNNRVQLLCVRRWRVYADLCALCERKVVAARRGAERSARWNSRVPRAASTTLWKDSSAARLIHWLPTISAVPSHLFTTSMLNGLVTGIVLWARSTAESPRWWNDRRRATAYARLRIIR